ncbi:FadR/GntR family transcriptional regulator [Microbacterium album]|uniref:GntR family transcriptional regulator n=1 Tax=Microbacterium album TaxID=2053191 RepID=A0A917IDF4_9MICO|nr:FCD domain-containing protein [Microbacterium album]GGH33322.1 GntR family transcriptional regulator [Microbacterium album]
MASLTDDVQSERSAFAGSRVRISQSVADGLVQEIEATIEREALAPGYRIGTKQELCERYGVASATLGEAMRVLRARGVIEVRPGPGGGLFVADQSPLIRLAHSVLKLRQDGATVNEIVAVLDALDEAVLRDAAEHRTEQDLIDLDALIAELAEVWGDPVAGLHCNWRLHRRIAQISPNAVLRTFYLNLVDYIEAESVGESSTFDVMGFHPDTDERLQIHRDLVEAIRTRDETLQRDAIVRHRTLGR